MVEITLSAHILDKINTDMPVLPNQPLTNAINQSASFGTQVGQSVTNSVQGALGLNPYMGRQNVAGMFGYSNNTAGPTPQVMYPQASYDWRVRISLAPNSNYFYNDPSNALLSPLRTESSNTLASAVTQAVGSFMGSGSNGQTRIGVVFPYTPSVTVTHSANYSEQKLTHNNYTQFFYQNSQVEAIQISGEFTVQNVNEGQYLLATIYFFRAVTKMFFGNDANAGNPPPLVYLNGYGEYYLPNVPCIVRSFQHNMPAEVDYVEVPEPGLTYNPYVTNPILNSTRLPTTSTITLSLQPVYSRYSQLGFNLNDFSRGALINAKGSNPSVTGYGQTIKPMNGGTASSGGFL
jgi:hypothetical protein